VLEVRNIVAGYGETTVLRDVSLSVPDGSVVAVLGPNGAGKTTMLRTVSGSLRPTAGSVLLEGEDISSLSTQRRVRQGICHIPEGRGVFPSFSVKENLLMFSAKGHEKEALDRAAAAFPPLSNRMNQIAGSLSGGEQQMLAIVRAYITDPKVVLVDEASMGLAPLVVESIFEFLGRIAKEGISLLIVEQYVSRALELADSVYLFSQGRVVKSGPAQDMKTEEIFEQYLGIQTADEPARADAGSSFDRN
jgi:branched-chain amino acid transport system ATP-binding protein